MNQTKTPARPGPGLPGSTVEGLPLRRRRGRASRPLGPMAFLIVKLVEKIGDELGTEYASGMTIEEGLSNLLGELVDSGQIYVTLRRLEKERGLLAAHDVRSPNGSGHTVTVYALTDPGRSAMARSAVFYRAVAEPIPPLKRGDHTDETKRKTTKAKRGRKSA